MSLFTRNNHSQKIKLVDLEVHQLLPADLACRVEYCNWFQNTLNNDRLLNLTFFKKYKKCSNIHFWTKLRDHQLKLKLLESLIDLNKTDTRRSKVYITLIFMP
jgi:hypothetical protein